MEQLRFAPIIRVSTEKQEKQGASLESQKQTIIDYVNSLHGVIPDYCWDYSGQEHATPGQERKKLEKLLSDSSKKIFDAVMVVDPSRWSRDNLKSKEGLNVLRTNGIRFFVGTMEYDLYSPEHNFYLGMSAEIGEMQARVQALKSTKSRIHNAKLNQPTAGKIPYGRTWDKKNKVWGIVQEKKLIIEQSAKRYLAGEGIPVIAKSYNMNPSNLHKILTQRCGTKWDISFNHEKVNIDETVQIEIPPLLDEETIKAIHQRIGINKTYTRGNHKYVYLLRGMIYCQRCGYKMESYHNHNDKTYYRHSKYGECDFKRLVPAIELENSLLIQLVQTFGDKEKIEDAIEKATPDLSKIESLNEEHSSLKSELDKIVKQRYKIIEGTSLGTFTHEQAKPLIEKINSREEEINRRVHNIESELSSIPNPKYIKSASEMASKVIALATKNKPSIIFKRSIEWKRRLIEQAFSGTNASGESLGVYVDYTTKKGGFTFEIRGMFESTVKTLPLTDEDLMNAFHLDSDYQDIEQELINIRSNLLSECDAHHFQCVY